MTRMTQMIWMIWMIWITQISASPNQAADKLSESSVSSVVKSRQVVAAPNNRSHNPVKRFML